MIIHHTKTYLANIALILAMLFLTACQTLHPQTPNQNSLSDKKTTWVLSVENQQNQISKLLLTDNQGRILQNLTQVQGKISGLTASFDKKFLLYTVQYKSFPEIYLFDLTSKKAKHILPKRANYFGASLSPDNQTLLFSATLTDNPEIFRKNLTSNDEQILTKNNHIDVSPMWLPNGKGFIFSSDNNASNQPKLYYYQFDNQKISQVGHYPYETNVRISPTENLITFFGRQDKVWQNFLLDLDSKAVIGIRDDKFADYVNFSPDGRHLIYPLQHQIITFATPKLIDKQFEPILQKQQTKILGLSDDERIKEVVWLY